jgi:4-amino-4-deoxy-L-arabinose transferase-like glycosyltransferase
MKKLTKLLTWQNFILILILAVGAFLRFYQLGNIPAGINRDEASIGYTAFSILKTGKEEHGKFLPLYIESFGDWKLPAYQYLSIPFIYLFGLSAFSVRFLSAISGVLLVFFVYVSAKILFRKNTSFNNWPAYLSALFIAINPWSLHISRIAFEANLACLFFVLGLTCFLKSLNHKKGNFIWGSLFWILALFSYHAAYVFLPLMFIVVLIYALRFKINKKQLFIGSFVFFAFLLMQLLQFINQSDVKITGVGITSDPVIKHLKTELIRFDHQNPASLGARVFHSRFLVYPFLILEKYLATFSADFLFFHGSNNFHHNITGFGNFYVANFMFFIFGVYIMFNKKYKYRHLILFWLLLSPIPSAITKNSPHSLRAIFLLPAYILITGLGAWEFFCLLKNKIIKSLIVLIYFMALLLNFSIYLDNYYVHAAITDAKHWNYGMDKLCKDLFSLKDKYQNIITTKPDYSDYIFYVFYNQYDPGQFQEQVKYYPRDNEGFRYVEKLNNLHFVWEITEYEAGNLYFDYAESVPHEAIVLGTYNLPNGDPYLVMFTI